MKQYRLKNKEKLDSYSKEWKAKNKEYLSEYQKKQYEENKDRILEGMLSKVKCDVCDKYVTKCHLLRHKRTKKHIKKMEENLNAHKMV